MYKAISDSGAVLKYIHLRETDRQTDWRADGQTGVHVRTRTHMHTQTQTRVVCVILSTYKKSESNSRKGTCLK